MVNGVLRIPLSDTFTTRISDPTKLALVIVLLRNPPDDDIVDDKTISVTVS
jgi:hypothetical protein